MKPLHFFFSALTFLSATPSAFSAARVMNPGEAKGQLVYLSVADVTGNSEKFRALSPVSIPVFAELPMELAVVSGSITLKQQTLLSHVQLKSRARKTPNLDISGLEGGLDHPLMKQFRDGQFIHMILKVDGSLTLKASTEAEAEAFYKSKQSANVRLIADLREKRIIPTEELGWTNFDKVGSKAANYGELARILNTPRRTVVRPGFGLPFFYYQQFIDTNPKIKSTIEALLRDPLMTKIAKVSYREQKLKALQALMTNEASVVSQDLVNSLLERFESMSSPAGRKRKIKLRSATNAEDLPNFNGAGLYDSKGYEPYDKQGQERDRAGKEKELRQKLRAVWASVWNLRAFEERAYFRIPHAEVKMGMQINPSFANEGADGVLVTRNIAHRPDLQGAGVYIESQRGDKFSVANPESGAKPEQVLVLFDEANPLNHAAYQVHILQRSNVSDDGLTLLGQDNPNQVMSHYEIKDVVYHALKAQLHFKTLMGRDKHDFALDMEFKVDAEDTGARQVYLKQARPYLE